jgi:ABC-type dipeptide/oligopeptide/nickel transport system permease component
LSRYLAQRLALLVFVLLGVTILVFLVTRLTPGDPARVLLGPRATEDQLARLRSNYGLDQPIYIQYVNWLSHVVRGDLGDSIQLHRPVLAEVGDRLRGTLLLAVAAMIVAFSAGIGAGLLAALHANSLLDRVLMSVLLVGISLPPFWAGLILIIIFSLLLRWLPATGMVSPTGGGTPVDILTHLVLPTLTLAAVPMAVIARLTRANVLEVLQQLYVPTAHAKGLPTRAVVTRHILRNTMIGTMTILGLEAGWLLAGTVYIETVFAWPGLGSMLVNAILQRDYPLVQGGVLLVATVYVLINLATDTLYLYIDPRLRNV